MVRYRPPTDWQQWVEWLAAGLHGRSRWRLSLILLGMVSARGRRTVTSWLRAVGIQDGFANYYYFLQPLGRKSKVLAGRLFTLLMLRLVTISLALRHPLWQTIGLPLLGLLYVQAKDIAWIPKKHRWKFRTQLELAASALLRFAKLAKSSGKALWTVADGAYAKRPFLKPLRAAGVTVVSRLRKDAALWTVPEAPATRKRGRPRKYGKQRIHLARRAAHPLGGEQLECFVYGEHVVKTIKTFLATYRPADGPIRVVIVKENHGCQFFFCIDPRATPREIIEAFADRAAIEQDFHDVKEVWGAGRQQVRNIWTNVAVFNLNRWAHTLVECWAWHKPAEEIRDRRDSPWDDPTRRPSHADRRKALRRQILHNEYSSLSPTHRASSKIRALYQHLLQLAA